MKRERVEVHIGITLKLGEEYEMFRADCTKSALLEEGDDPKEVDTILTEECKQMLRQQYMETLEARRNYFHELHKQYLAVTPERAYNANSRTNP